MEKSGLCMVLGAHSRDETCGWAVVASVLRLRQREARGGMGCRLARCQARLGRGDLVRTGNDRGTGRYDLPKAAL